MENRGKSWRIGEVNDCREKKINAGRRHGKEEEYNTPSST